MNLKRVFLIVVLGMVFISSVLSEEITIQKVYFFPERYEGQTMIFTKVFLEKYLRKEEGVFLLWIKQNNETILTEDLVFIVSADIAERLLDETIYGEWVRLTCMIQRRKFYTVDWWVADVVQIDFLDFTKKGYYDKEIAIYKTIP